MTPAGEVVRELPQRPAFGLGERFQMVKDSDHTMALAAETLAEGKSVLIFCATKRVRCMAAFPVPFAALDRRFTKGSPVAVHRLPQLVGPLCFANRRVVSGVYRSIEECIS